MEKEEGKDQHQLRKTSQKKTNIGCEDRSRRRKCWRQNKKTGMAVKKNETARRHRNMKEQLTDVSGEQMRWGWGGGETGCTPTKESSKGHPAYACGRHTAAKEEVQQKRVSAETGQRPSPAVGRPRAGGRSQQPERRGRADSQHTRAQFSQRAANQNTGYYRWPCHSTVEVLQLQSSLPEGLGLAKTVHPQITPSKLSIPVQYQPKM